MISNQLSAIDALNCYDHNYGGYFTGIDYCVVLLMKLKCIQVIQVQVGYSFSGPLVLESKVMHCVVH